MSPTGLLLLLLLLLGLNPGKSTGSLTNIITKLIWNDHQSGWSSTQKLSCSNTELNRCTTTETRCSKKELSRSSPNHMAMHLSTSLSRSRADLLFNGPYDSTTMWSLEWNTNSNGSKPILDCFTRRCRCYFDRSARLACRCFNIWIGRFISQSKAYYIQDDWLSCLPRDKSHATRTLAVCVSSLTGIMPAELKAFATTSFKTWCCRALPGACMLAHKATEATVINLAPQTVVVQFFGVDALYKLTFYLLTFIYLLTQRLRPRHNSTAVLTASSTRFRPQDEIGCATNQSPL